MSDGDAKLLEAIEELRTQLQTPSPSTTNKSRPHWMVQAAFGIALASGLGALGSWFDLEANVAANRSEIAAHRQELGKREAPIDSIQLLDHRIRALENKTPQLDSVQRDVSAIRAALCQHPEFKISGCRDQ